MLSSRNPSNLERHGNKRTPQTRIRIVFYDDVLYLLPTSRNDPTVNTHILVVGSCDNED